MPRRGMDSPPLSQTDLASDPRATLARALVEVGNGDRRAFATVYERTSAKLFGVCLRILKNRSEAEEALQEAYINVWRKAGAFDPVRASPISWLAALARNKAIDRLRARGNRVTANIDDEVLAVADPAPSALEQVVAGQTAEQLSRCIGELGDEQATAVREAFYGGETYAELAARKKVPVGTMKSWIRRSLQRLKACLEQ